MTNIEIVTLISIGLTFFIGVFNLIITFRNVKKTTFINSVTASRIKYIQDLRESISRFCGLANEYSQEWDIQRGIEFHQEANSLKYLIRLYLNPEDKYWDTKIISLIDQILIKSNNNIKSDIDELITITQYLLKLEWEGAKKESAIGTISEIKKKDLYNRYVKLHEKHTS